MSWFSPEVALTGGGTVIMGVIGYFLKKQSDKIDNTAAAVTTLATKNAESIAALSDKFETRIDRLEEKMELDAKSNKQETIQIFQDICHERQNACKLLRDEKLARVEAQTKVFCAKVERISEDRDKKWQKQDDLNERIKRVLYTTKNGGASWELKDRNKD